MGYAKDRRLWAGIRFGRRLLPQSVSVARRIVQGGVETVGGGGDTALADINTRSLSRLASACINKDAENTREIGPSSTNPGNGSPGTLL